MPQCHPYDKIEFITKTAKRDKKVYYVMIKSSIQWEDVNIIKANSPISRASPYLKQMLKDLKEHLNFNTSVMGDFNTSVS